MGPEIAGLGGLASIMAATVAAVFAMTGAMKFRRSAAPEMRRLGLPLPRVLAIVVPIAEVATARTLVTTPRLGGLMALILLTAFTAVLVRTIRSGESVSCGCLGSFSDAPITWMTVYRNGVLAFMALGATQTEVLTSPDLASVLAFVGFVLVAGIAGQLLTTWRELGRLWSVELAGEPSRPSLRRSP